MRIYCISQIISEACRNAINIILAYYEIRCSKKLNNFALPTFQHSNPNHLRSHFLFLFIHHLPIFLLFYIFSYFMRQFTIFLEFLCFMGCDDHKNCFLRFFQRAFTLKKKKTRKIRPTHPYDYFCSVTAAKNVLLFRFGSARRQLV